MDNSHIYHCQCNCLYWWNFEVFISSYAQRLSTVMMT